MAYQKAIALNIFLIQGDTKNMSIDKILPSAVDSGDEADVNNLLDHRFSHVRRQYHV